jgi:hypothetical protein
MELTGIEAPHHFFWGTSVLRGDEGPQHLIPLVQPYAGVYLELVRWPYKVIKNIRSDHEYLFDLDQDAAESRDLIGEAGMATIRRQFDQGFEALLLNQGLLQSNQIWPEDVQPGVAH